MEHGKRKTAVVACMVKLLRFSYGVLMHQKPFGPARMLAASGTEVPRGDLKDLLTLGRLARHPTEKPRLLGDFGRA